MTHTTDDIRPNQPDSTVPSPSGDRVEQLLRFDPIAAAERISATDDPRDASTALLSIGLAGAHAEAKQQALQATADTWSGMPFIEHLAVFVDLGFEVVLNEPFTSRDGQREEFVVLWHPDGILGSCESFAKWNSTNSSHIHYAWRPNDPDTPWWAALGGGSWAHGVFYGDQDTREGLRHTIEDLRSRGAFRRHWTGRPAFEHPWEHLGTYAEWNSGESRETWKEDRIARFRRLPEEIQSTMGGWQ